MSRQSGFTLIELLVTMTILTMIIVIGSSAFSLFAQRWSGEVGSFNSKISDARNLMLIQDVLDSLIPWVAYDEFGKPFMYFEGNRNGFVAVSSRSLYSFGDYSVVRLSVVERRDMTFDVLYEEWPMSDDLLFSTSQKISFFSPILLYRSVSNPTFEYLGWANAEDRASIGDLAKLPSPQWLKSYNGIYALFPPQRAKLSFEKEGESFMVSSTLNSPNPGLLSRYKPQPFRFSSKKDVPNTDQVDGFDDCDC